MKLKRIIECADRRAFDKLTQEQVNHAEKITVGGVVVKNRSATGAARR
jgi:hypothetical protein